MSIESLLVTPAEQRALERFYRHVIDADPALAGRAGAAWRQALGVDLALARQQAGDHASQKQPLRRLRRPDQRHPAF